MPMYAGVDGGGSKTLAVVINETGQEVGRGLAANANYQVLMTQGHSDKQAAALVVERIDQALAHALPQPSDRLVRIFAGLAGVDRPNDAAIIRQALSESGLHSQAEWQVVNDAELILYGLKQGVGLGLIAGTGSIAIGRDSRGQKVRAGGWGHILGDEGSGYEIGRAALQVAVQAADKRGPATQLLPRILTEWQLPHAESLIEAVYNISEGRNQKIARLASFVFELAHRGDAVATHLAEKAAADLAAAVWAVYSQLDFDQSAPPLGLGGGLLLNTPTLKAGVLSQLQKLGYQPEQIVEVNDPALAAAIACLQHTYSVDRE